MGATCLIYAATFNRGGDAKSFAKGVDTNIKCFARFLLWIMQKNKGHNHLFFTEISEINL